MLFSQLSGLSASIIADRRFKGVGDRCRFDLGVDALRHFDEFRRVAVAEFIGKGIERCAVVQSQLAKQSEERGHTLNDAPRL